MFVIKLGNSRDKEAQMRNFSGVLVVAWSDLTPRPQYESCKDCLSDHCSFSLASLLESIILLFYNFLFFFPF